MAPLPRRGKLPPRVGGIVSGVGGTTSSGGGPTTSASQVSSFSNQPSTSFKTDYSNADNDYSSGLSLSRHPIWPDLGNTQGELFFECTLFLYSVLALFLQYINLYKSLWWLPKSFWHYSMKLHNINPYFLSCVGLLLGLRVTKCFWSTISYIFNNVCEGKSDKIRQALNLIQYGLVKVPMTTMILTSFFFSFTRILREFPPSAVIYFFFPPFAYTLLFFTQIQQRFWRFWKKTKEVMRKEATLNELVDTLLMEDEGWLDLDTVAHLCSGVASQVRQEIDILMVDCYLRIKRCLFAGLSTAFLSIFLPLAFLPYKTSVGLPQKVLISEIWQVEMAIIVFCTAFTHYVTYLFPLHYIDFMYRSAMHLGRWEEDESAGTNQLSGYLSTKKIPPTVVHAFTTPALLWHPQAPPYAEGTVVEIEGGKRFKAVPLSPKIKTVSSQPDNVYHHFFTKWISDPLSIINYLCLSELLLIFLQFWLLVLTLEWQHILTLVFLMFANYLLLGKLFKDRVILQRIYEPSKEDIQMIQQMESMKGAAMNMKIIQACLDPK